MALFASSQVLLASYQGEHFAAPHDRSEAKWARVAALECASEDRDALRSPAGGGDGGRGKPQVAIAEEGRQAEIELLADQGEREDAGVGQALDLRETAALKQLS